MKRMSIFVIDDDPAVLRSHVRILSKAHSVTASLDAEDLLDALRIGTVFDAILSDVDMPGMSGKVLFEALAKEFPEYRSKIVFMTGGADPEVVRYLNSNAKVLYKPADSAALLATMQAIGGG